MNHEATVPLPSHLTSRIAAEIHDSIIDHLHSCKPVLYTCSTVCKAWLPTCRYHLFSRVNLRPAFVEFLRSSPHTATAISPYISQVTLGGGWMREQQAEFNEVISFLLTLERVNELYLGTWSWDYVSTETTVSLLDARASLFQNLTKLAMTHIRFSSFTFLIRFISGFPVLKELSLHNITWEAPKCPLSPLPSASTTIFQASPLLPSRLQTLNILSSSNSPILCWVLTGGRLHAATDHEQVVPALRKLLLPDILPTESHLVGSLLRTVGPSLQHLELGFLTHNASPHAIQDALNAIDLSHNTDLRVICIHQLILYQFPPLTPTLPSSSITTTTNSPYAWLTPLLAHINSPHLAEITFNMWLSMESQLDLIDWTGLAKVFTNPHFAGLRRLRFEVCGMGRDRDEVKGWIRRRLRECEGKELYVRFADA